MIMIATAQFAVKPLMHDVGLVYVSEQTLVSWAPKSEVIEVIDR